VSPLISQTVTIINNDTVICLPLLVSKQIVLDLESGDLCAEELELIKEDTTNLNKKIHYLSNVVSLLEGKEKSYINQINTYQQVDSLKTDKIKTLDSKLTTTKNIKNVLIGTSIGLLIISILLIL